MIDMGSHACPIATVIVPVYNTAQYLEACLESLVNQTVRDIEILCVDDGSTDGSGELLDAWAEKDDHIVVVHQANAGVSRARNEGLDLARGEYVLFVDSDDYIELDACEKLIGIAQRDDSDIVVFGGETFPPVGWIDGVLDTPDTTCKGDSYQALFGERGSYPLMCNKMYRRALLDTHHIRFNSNLKLGEDNAFQFCVFPHARVVSFCSDMLYHYRCEREGSAISTFYGDRLAKVKKHFAIVEYVAEEWRRQGFIAGHEAELLSWASTFLYDDNKHLSYSDRQALARRFRAILDGYDLECGMEGLTDDERTIVDLMLCEAHGSLDEPVLSVVATPCADVERLEEGFSLLASQSLQRMELLCVDDRSDSEVTNALARLAEGDERARLVSSTNEGMEAARGQYVLFTDLSNQYSWRTFEILLRLFDDAGGPIEVISYRDALNVLCSLDLRRRMGMLAGTAASAEEKKHRAYFAPDDLPGVVFTFSSLDASNKVWKTEFARRVKLDPRDPCSVALALLEADAIAPSTDQPYAVGTYEGISASEACALGRALSESMERLRAALEDRGVFARYEKSYINAVLSEGMRHYRLMRSEEAAVAYLEFAAVMFERAGIPSAYGKAWFMDQGMYEEACALVERGAHGFMKLDRFAGTDSLMGRTAWLEGELAKCSQRLEETERCLKVREHELKEFEESISYRAGRAITFVPRAVMQSLRRTGQ